MPFTPYHFGPNGFVGLIFRKWLDLPILLLANVVIDIEVLFASGRMPHRYWHFHTSLIGGLIGVFLGLAVYFIKPICRVFALIMRFFSLEYQANLWKMVFSGLIGAWMHVGIDSLYHYDLEPFWPRRFNPIWRWAVNGPIRIEHGDVKFFCIVFWVLAIVVYLFIVLKNRKLKRASVNTQNKIEAAPAKEHNGGDK